MQMNVYLVGYMGTGKTTSGKKLAARLGMDFLDLDQYIELQEGQSPAEIIRKKREGVFRELEYRYLKITSMYPNTLVATGGGAPTYKDAMTWMNQNGTTVYLKATPEALQSRLAQSKTDRPLLKDKIGEELLEHISEQLIEREAFYQLAHITVDALSLTKEKLDQLAGLIRQKEEVGD